MNTKLFQIAFRKEQKKVLFPSGEMDSKDRQMRYWYDYLQLYGSKRVVDPGECKRDKIILITCGAQQLSMPPKKQSKIVVKKQEEEGQQGEEKSELKKGTQKFSCICGKVYGSLAAVHTHINNKHTDEKKKYKSQIINPKKNGQPASTSIRMKDINYPEVQAQLMCHADINLKNIYDIYKEIDKNGKDILIDINEDLSDDSDIDIDDLLSQSESGRQRRQGQSKRQKTINQKVRMLKNNYRIEIDDYLIGARELESFKIQKFRLSLIRELSKFFVIDFAADVELSLQMIHVFRKHQAGGTEMGTLMQQALDIIWNRFSKVKELLFNYYDEWIMIKDHFKVWRENQQRQEREREREREHEEN